MTILAKIYGKWPKKTIFGQFWDFSESLGIENVRNDHFRHFLSQESPKNPKIAQKSSFWIFSIHFGYIVLCSQNVWNIVKKDNIGLVWDISDSSVIENVGNGHFRRFLSRESPKYPKIAQKLYCPKQRIP